MADVLELVEVPYGNAQMVGGEPQCQHGPEECQGNKYECCAIQSFPNQTQWFPFVSCMEAAGDSMLQSVGKCANQAGISKDTIETCYNGDAGTQCIKNAAKQTNSLNPPHQYTPWITVNGRHLSNTDHLTSVVCSEMTGPKPSICNGATDDDSHQWDDDQGTRNFEPCWKDGVEPHTL